ncbi:hypothetical protein QJS10_CPB15g01894 [Acorus calamus]|uniref:Uncharacterized protein n=1 Tax=Acorus calamus TaxID=4465 RepID=A0AAV9D5C2_ACOCL|nr:hypothetical protein QJS10_CPB15g01894 [Acorus calamus]
MISTTSLDEFPSGSSMKLGHARVAAARTMRRRGSADVDGGWGGGGGFFLEGFLGRTSRRVLEGSVQVEMDLKEWVFDGLLVVFVREERLRELDRGSDDGGEKLRPKAAANARH